ncbi:MAG: hypothetical protein H2212_18590 [Ruminococcus sp.]|nr:hypothetical protein [Ruminococcus sp.]
MSDVKMFRKNIISLILAGVVLCAFLLSDLYISDHIEHHCTGEDCKVCTEIQHAESMINQMGGAVVPVMVMTGIISIVISFLPFIYSFIQKETLISEKVRLNN